MNKPAISKLIKFKSWLTLPDAAKHLTGVGNEEVTEADILQLALDGYLKLSVNFVSPVPAMPGKVVGYEDIEWEGIQTDDGIVKEMKSIDIGEGRYLNLSNEIIKISQVWDLVMSHCGRTDVKNRVQNLTSGAEVEPDINDEGFFVELDGQVCRVHIDIENVDYIPGSAAQLEKLRKSIKDGEILGEEAENQLRKSKEAREKLNAIPYEDRCIAFYDWTLPKGGDLVVRRKALIEFERISVDEKQKINVDLSETERNTMLKLIIGMAIDAYGYDPDNTKNSATGKNNGSIKSSLERVGLSADEKTIKKYLEAAAELFPDAKPRKT